MKKLLITLLFFAIGLVPAFSNEAEYIDALQRCVNNGLSINEQYSACVEIQNNENVPEALQEAVFFRKIHLVATSKTDSEKRQQMLDKYKQEALNISDNYKVNRLYEGLYEIAVGNQKKGEKFCDEAFSMMIYESGNTMRMKAKGIYKDIYTLVGFMCSDDENAFENIKNSLQKKDK